MLHLCSVLCLVAMCLLRYACHWQPSAARMSKQEHHLTKLPCQSFHFVARHLHYPSSPWQDNEAIKAGLSKYVKKKKLERLDS